MVDKVWDGYRDSFGGLGDYFRSHYLTAVPPMPSNIAPLDALLCGGFRPGLHVVGGEPAAGKSAFGLFLSMMAALSGGRVLYVSLEMSRGQCIERCASFASLSTGQSFRWGDVWRLALGARERAEAGERIEQCVNHGPVALALKALEERFSGLAIADGSTIADMSGIERIAEDGRKSGLGLLVVDYLQYVSVDGIADEYTRVSEASKRLNMLGVRLGPPVIALASCSRAGNAKGKPPDMHSFKGSGDIEYHALSASVIERSVDDPDARRLHVVKNRFGGVTDPDSPIRLLFDGAHNSFSLEQ